MRGYCRSTPWANLLHGSIQACISGVRLCTMVDAHVHILVRHSRGKFHSEAVNDWNHLVDQNSHQLRYMLGHFLKDLHAYLSKYKIQRKQNKYIHAELAASVQGCPTHVLPGNTYPGHGENTMHCHTGMKLLPIAQVDA